ncbi:hypothetical protein EV182_000166 [Spiromyces aspiralis]|uniref:Uncharacterized protein n=1 Tax=Spiromyces aspiralis TaxID=68401 RepID=A0ACC1HI02_9FUNG|nr:hypothetical protein EV182_000166 [Spiromyces aspiralis]
MPTPSTEVLNSSSITFQSLLRSREDKGCVEGSENADEKREKETNSTTGSSCDGGDNDNILNDCGDKSVGKKVNMGGQAVSSPQKTMADEILEVKADLERQGSDSRADEDTEHESEPSPGLSAMTVTGRKLHVKDRRLHHRKSFSTTTEPIAVAGAERGKWASQAQRNASVRSISPVSPRRPQQQQSEGGSIPATTSIATSTVTELKSAPLSSETTNKNCSSSGGSSSSSNNNIGTLESTMATIAAAQQPRRRRQRLRGFTVFKRAVGEQFAAETNIIENDPNLEIKWDRVVNYMQIPYQLENFIVFGGLVCLDTLLHTLTVVPLQTMHTAGVVLWRAVTRRGNSSSGGSRIGSAQVYTAAKGLLMLVTCALLRWVDTAKLYHSIRAQNTVKLAVIFSALDIFDRLCASFGLDVIHSLHLTISKALFSSELPADRGGGNKRGRACRWYILPAHLTLALVYMLVHTMIIYYQMITWTVAINSYGQQLLTLLIANQFAEIKSTVFKRWEKENLFQLACADVVERFQLAVFLGMISGYNFLELVGGNTLDLSGLSSGPAATTTTGNTGSPPFVILGPTVATAAATTTMTATGPIGSIAPIVPIGAGSSGGSSSSGTNPNVGGDSPLMSMLLSTSVFGHLLSPILMIYGSELIIDWLKHAFITKFNWVRPQVYRYYRVLLCEELVKPASPLVEPYNSRNEAGNDQRRLTRHSLKVTRRLGFISLPLACVIVLVFMQSLSSGLGFLIGSHLVSNIYNWVCEVLPCSVVPANTGFLAYANRFSLALCTAAIYLALFVFKLFLGVNLATFATRQAQRATAAESRPSLSLAAVGTATTTASSGRTRAPPQRSVSSNGTEFYTPFKALDQLERKQLRHLVALYGTVEDAEWESKRPKWNLENIERYELFKSRIP